MIGAAVCPLVCFEASETCFYQKLPNLSHTPLEAAHPYIAQRYTLSNIVISLFFTDLECDVNSSQCVTSLLCTWNVWMKDVHFTVLHFC